MSGKGVLGFILGLAEASGIWGIITMSGDHKIPFILVTIMVSFVLIMFGGFSIADNWYKN